MPTTTITTEALLAALTAAGFEVVIKAQIGGGWFVRVEKEIANNRRSVEKITDHARGSDLQAVLHRIANFLRVV